MKNLFKVVGLGLVGLATSANAALTVDTTAINADIATASGAGIAIALAVAAAVIAIGLVKKLVRP